MLGTQKVPIVINFTYGRFLLSYCCELFEFPFFRGLALEVFVLYMMQDKTWINVKAMGGCDTLFLLFLFLYL